jgi:carnitine 3-dehydrogenase
MDTLMGPLAAMWPSLGNPEATPEVKQKIVAGVTAEAGGHSVGELAAERDAMLLGLLAVRAKYEDTGQPAPAATQPA